MPVVSTGGGRSTCGCSQRARCYWTASCSIRERVLRPSNVARDEFVRTFEVQQLAYLVDSRRRTPGELTLLYQR